MGRCSPKARRTEVIEGNHYFPPNSIHREHFRDSDHHTVCGWKGTASYYDVVVNGQTNRPAASSARTQSEVENIRDYVAFWKGVEVQF